MRYINDGFQTTTTLANAPTAAGVKAIVYAAAASEHYAGQRPHCAVDSTALFCRWFRGESVWAV